MARVRSLKTQDVLITESSLNESLSKMEPAAQAQFAKHKFFLLEKYAMNRILLQEAKKAGFKDSESEEEMIMELLAQKASQVTVTDEELKQLYAQNKEALGGQPFDQVRDALEGYLIDEKRRTCRWRIHLGTRQANSHPGGREVGGKAKPSCQRQSGGPGPELQVNPRWWNSGPQGCVPCDMMQPVLENLRKKYQERLNIVFVHVGEDQILGARYGITSIPVQAFFDHSGKEVFRHTGFFAQAEVEKKLTEMGVR